MKFAFRSVVLFLLSLLLMVIGSPVASGQQAGSQEFRSGEAAVVWLDDYGTAMRQARSREKMLLIHFTSPQSAQLCRQVEDRMASDDAIATLARDFVFVRLPVDAAIQVDRRRVALLRHGSMREMHGSPGLAIIDMKHKDQPYYGHTVSSFPYLRSKYYQFRVEYLPSIMSLPPGTITQRTMVWAVRVHPEKPASTRGQRSTVLSQAAGQHSEYQARLGVQGHHRWDRRFHLLRRLLGFRSTPVEVVAESWPNQTMIDSCIDCVASWRQSSGHWNAVKSYQTQYGYDIKLGSNGIWYGTGIFSR